MNDIELSIVQLEDGKESGKELAFLKRLKVSLVEIHHDSLASSLKKKEVFTKLFKAFEIEEDYEIAAKGYIKHYKLRKKNLERLHFAFRDDRLHESVAAICAAFWDDMDTLQDTVRWIENAVEDLALCKNVDMINVFCLSLITAISEKIASLQKGERVSERWFLATVVRITGWYTENPYSFADSFLQWSDDEDEDSRIEEVLIILNRIQVTYRERTMTDRFFDAFDRAVDRLF